MSWDSFGARFASLPPASQPWLPASCHSSPVGHKVANPKPLVTNSRSQSRVTAASHSSFDGSGDPGDGCFVVFFLFGR